MPACRQCSAGFEITPADRRFYDRISVPDPTLCPDCRQQRRACFRNELNLYHRTCDATGKEMITMYRPETALKVVTPDYWWSDAWDPLSFGRDFDFSRPFFEQYKELQAVVPRLALYGKNNENSDYTNHTENTKNTYMSADVGAGSDDIYYSKWIISCRSLIDCYQLEKSEQCYNSQYSVGSYGDKFIYLANESVDSDFLYNCKGVKNGLMCWNLRNKQYVIENKVYSPEEYHQMLANYDTGSSRNLQTYLARYEALIKNAVRKPAEIINSEGCTGDYLENCKNVTDSYGVIDSRDVRFAYDSGHLNDCYDVYEPAFDCEWQYECHASNRSKWLIGCSVSYDMSNASYCEMCHNSENLFGCIALRHKKYCILNKQYTKEEYEAIVPKIIAHMRKTGEWGEFFPRELSAFAYNESAAPEFTRLTKPQAIAQGWRWLEDKNDFRKQTYVIPDHIRDVPDSISRETLACLDCHRNYRVINQELRFYRDRNLPIPRKCPHCRYFDRLKWRNPYKLWPRACAKCGIGVQTTYAPERPEIVFCEACYLKEVY